MITRKQSDLWVLEGKTPGAEKTLCLLTEKNIQIYPFSCDLDTATALRQALGEAINLILDKQVPAEHVPAPAPELQKALAPST